MFVDRAAAPVTTQVAYELDPTEPDLAPPMLNPLERLALTDVACDKLIKGLYKINKDFEVLKLNCKSVPFLFL